MTMYWHRRVAVALVICLVSIPTAGYGQSGEAPSDLRDRLRERYDIVALQRGVALVPRDPAIGIRMIQITEGVVTVDGETLTGQQLRDKLGPDADPVLQVSYLDQARQRDLAEAEQAAPSAAASDPAPLARTEVTRGDIVRFGGGVRVGRDERVQGDVVAIGGSVDVDGEVSGDVVGIGGAVTLGPNAVVQGDVTAVGGGLSRAPGARIFGRVDEVGVGGSGYRQGQGRRFAGLSRPFWPAGFAATVLRLALLVLLGLAALALGRGSVEQVAAQAGASPLRSGLVGLLAEIFFLPVLILTVVVLAVSIIGIPFLVLVPFAVLLVILVMLVGFAGLAYQVGRLLTARFGWAGGGAMTTVAIGVVAVGSLTLVGHLAGLGGGVVLGVPLTALGYFVEYVAWTVGFGATILAWYKSRAPHAGSQTALPPLPGEAQA